MTAAPFRLRPRARLLHTIGSELISSESVAVVELVKNAYDADARRVVLRFVKPLSVGEGRLDVLDDGYGMGIAVIENVWLDIATPHRTTKRTTPGGRRVLGEKGIGRFAAARLADELHMFSREPQAPLETRLHVDWRDFRDPERFLDDIDLDVVEVPPASFETAGLVEEIWRELQLPSADHGTLLSLEGFSRTWKESDLLALRRDLSRLVRPNALGVAPDFEIHLDLPQDLTHLAGPIEPPVELANPPYYMKVAVAANGRASLDIHLPGHKPAKTRIQLDAAREYRDEEGRLACGPLDIEIKVFDRDREAVSRLAVSGGLPLNTKSYRHLLDQLAGVSVYRDGFRVLPFGEQGDDWLNLDARRVNNPALRLSNSQVIGAVVISSQKNPDLRDQTNREGLMQGSAFTALRQIVLEALSSLENERFRQRRQDETDSRGSGKRGRSLFAALTLRDVVEAVRTSPNPDPKLLRLVERAEERVSEGVERVRDVLARYQRLATLGKLVDEIVHDGQSSVGRIRRATREGHKQLRQRSCDPEAARELVKAVDLQGEFLATLFRRIAPFGGRKRGRPRQVSALHTVEQAVEVLSSTARRAGADVLVCGDDPQITVDPAEMQELVINLLDNALYWVQKVPADKRRVEVRVERPNPSALIIIVDDSGPGVPEGLREAIFEPYFSSKPDGGGLGLSIVGELIADAYDGQLDLVASQLGGAAFQLTFARRVG